MKKNEKWNRPTIQFVGDKTNEQVELTRLTRKLDLEGHFMSSTHKAEVLKKIREQARKLGIEENLNPEFFS